MGERSTIQFGCVCSRVLLVEVCAVVAVVAVVVASQLVKMT